MYWSFDKGISKLLLIPKKVANIRPNLSLLSECDNLLDKHHIKRNSKKHGLCIDNI